MQIASSSVNKSWRELYKIAVFEEDKSKLPTRIDDAEASLLSRARELFHAGIDDVRERLEVDAALYALYALKSATMSAEAKKKMYLSDQSSDKRSDQNSDRRSAA